MAHPPESEEPHGTFGSPLSADPRASQPVTEALPLPTTPTAPPTPSIAPAPASPPEPAARRLPWYRDLRFAIGLFAAPFFFFAPAIIRLVAPDLSPEQAAQAAQAMQFISGALVLFPLAAVIEAVTEYYEHNFLHQHDRYNALLRAGLLHTTFTNFAFLVLMLFTLGAAQQQAHGAAGVSANLVRIVQVSIAGAIVVSILFNLGVSIFLGGLNFKHHGGRLNFSKELANQDAEMLTIAVIILSLPTLASRLNISPGFLDKVTYRVPESTIADLSVIVSGVMLFIYVSYLLWTVLKVGDVQGATTEDVGDEVLNTLFRAINKVFATHGAVSLYDALRSPSLYYPDTQSQRRDMNEIQRQMDELDAALEDDEEEERAHVRRMQEENLRREQLRHQHKQRRHLTAPLRAVRTGVAAFIFIVVSPVLMLYRAVTAPLRWWQRRRHQRALREEQLQRLPVEEATRRARRDERRQVESGELRHEPLLLVIGRIVRLVLGVGGAVFVLDRMASSIEGGLVEGLGLNPFFVGFIILPIAAGLVDITTATRKAWNNEVQNTLAITAGSAVQSALLIGPLILILSRLPFIALADINLVFGLFILALFGLIAYFYQIMTVDGETTWFEGAQLLGIFAAVAIVVYFAQAG
jgi:Ca2+/H+ antiporter